MDSIVDLLNSNLLRTGSIILIAGVRLQHNYPAGKVGAAECRKEFWFLKIKIPIGSHGDFVLDRIGSGTVLMRSRVGSTTIMATVATAFFRAGQFNLTFLTWLVAYHPSYNNA